MAATIPAISKNGALTVTDDNSNSATMLYHQADHALDGLEPNGFQAIEVESGGVIIGVLDGDRAIPTFSVSAVSASSLSAFEEMLMGTTSGFTSTLVDISGNSPTPATDVSWTFNIGAESRAYSFEDCRWTIGKKAGDPYIASYTCKIYGLVKARDDAGVWTTLIASR